MSGHDPYTITHGPFTTTITWSDERGRYGFTDERGRQFWVDELGHTRPGPGPRPTPADPFAGRFTAKAERASTIPRMRGPRRSQTKNALLVAAAALLGAGVIAGIVIAIVSAHQNSVDASHVLVVGGSCEQQLSTGRLIFSVSLRNDSPRAVTVDVTPVRRFDDGSTNDSGMDTQTGVRIAANGVRSFWTPLTADSSHTLVSCGARVGGHTHSLPTNVVS